MKTDLFKLQDIFSEDFFSLRGTGCFSGQVHCLNVTFRLNVIAQSISTQHHIYTNLQYIYVYTFENHISILMVQLHIHIEY